jgi:alpha-L-fucosidase
LEFLTHYYNSALQWKKDVIVTYKMHDLAVGSAALDFERGGSNDVLPLHWQTDDAMDRGSWSWVTPPNLKNETELINELVDIVSKNGNLLLDIPPHADGSIDPQIQKTLFAMGDWLKINGEAIFATKPWSDGPYGEGPTKISPGSFHEWPSFTSTDFRFTQNAKAVFATVLAWSADGSFVIKSWNSTSGAENAPSLRHFILLTVISLTRQLGTNIGKFEKKGRFP